MKWFKFYGQDFLTDSKLSGLNPFQRLMWVVLLCMASQDEKKTGILKFFDEKRLVELSGLNYNDMESMYGMKRNVTLETFCNMGLVTWLDTTTLHVTNYNRKQTQNATSTERVAAWRASKKAPIHNKTYVTDVTNVTLQSNGRGEERRGDKSRVDNITSPAGETANAVKFKKMKGYNEDKSYDPPVINADTGELEVETKENQNLAWADFKRFWLELWEKERKFIPEISLVADKSTFHRQYKLRGREEIRKIAKFYLTLEKSHEYPSITACFSADTLNQFKMPKSGGITVIGKKNGNT